MNHSCNPNCVLQKWVVGNRMRMGIFALKDIEAGTELTFDYNFEVYGQEAQVCYCLEENCKGYIGGDNKSKDAGQLVSSGDEAECIFLFQLKLS